MRTMAFWSHLRRGPPRPLWFNDPETQTVLTIRLRHALADVQRNAGASALLFLDVDNFSDLSEDLADPVELLNALNARLRGALKLTDGLWRADSDEFWVLLERVGDAAVAAAVAERLVKVVAAAPFASSSGSVKLTVSVGITLLEQGDEAPPEDLCQRAVLALHAAKQGGRNTYRFDCDKTNQTLRWQRRVVDRLKADEFSINVALQPQMRLSTGEPAAFEALLRAGPIGGAVMAPAQLLPIAEQTGYIHDMGERALFIACQRARDEMALPLAVNLSGAELGRDQLAQQLRAVVSRAGLSPSDVELEIDESLLLQRPEFMGGVLRECRGMGFGLVLDNFGRHASRLSELTGWPLTKLKLDASLVQGAVDARGEAILAALVALAHACGLTVVATGVETVEQREAAARAGCDLAQGYLYGKPRLAS